MREGIGGLPLRRGVTLVGFFRRPISEEGPNESFIPVKKVEVAGEFETLASPRFQDLPDSAGKLRQAYLGANETLEA